MQLNVHVPDGELNFALASTRCCLVLDSLSNSLPSDLFPSDLRELGPILKNDKIYQGYSEQLALKFPSHCQVVIYLEKWHANVVCEWMPVFCWVHVFLVADGLTCSIRISSKGSRTCNKQEGTSTWRRAPTCPCTGSINHACSVMGANVYEHCLLAIDDTWFRILSIVVYGDGGDGKVSLHTISV